MLLNLGWTDEMQMRFIDALPYASSNDLDLQLAQGSAMNGFHPNTSTVSGAEASIAAEPDV